MSSSSSTTPGAGASNSSLSSTISSGRGGARPSIVARASTTGSIPTARTSSSQSASSSMSKSANSMSRTYSSRSSGLLASSGIGGAGGSKGGSSMGSSGSSSTSGSSSENLPPRTLARVARDVRDLIKKPPEGVRLVVDEETGMPGSLSEVLAEIEGPTDTPYATRYFRLKLVLPTDFPSTPPRGHFLTKIYHPNVDATTGAICVNTLKRDWTSTTSLSHVLTVIRCLLMVPFPESSLNDEAGKMFMDSYDEYARRAKLMAGVHGMLSYSSVSDYVEENDSDGKKKAKRKEDGNGINGSLPNSAGGGSGKSNNENVKLGKNGSRSNIVRGSSKSATDKKSKKKSLKRL